MKDQHLEDLPIGKETTKIEMQEGQGRDSEPTNTENLPSFIVVAL